MFTQSGIKPMTSVDMSRRYVAFYDSFAESDAIVIAGFGFNGDDGHINGLLRHAVDVDGKPIVVLSYNDQGTNDEVTAEYGKRTRIERIELLKVLRVDRARRVEGRPWIDAVVEVLQT